jgi:hypothetical protein
MAKPARVFSHKPKVPCPKCYAPLDAKGYCHSRGCALVWVRGEAAQRG